MKVENGHNVKVHYVGTLEDGSEFDNSHNRGETLEFEVGAGKMIKGFDSALVGMTVGESKKITLSPDQAYGERIEEAMQTVPKTTFPAEFSLEEGQVVRGANRAGQPMMAIIAELTNDEVVLDLNHPLAGKELNFEIELVEIQQ
tara:strand:- start:868 stop:1299 length:432 start_codon:yes stop_codon:yes gene_type:complete